MSKELMKQRIEMAQKRIDEVKDEIREGRMRQKFHFMPQAGWLNDPNGLIYFKGKYHFFYQYNPYYGHWDYMHWGHAVSDDLIHWEYLPLALAPSEWYDDHYRGGCFSGSAIEYEGRLYLIYTSVSYNGYEFESTQCIAYSQDGVVFEKYDGNPVLTAPDWVDGDQFRDPKVWKHDEHFYMICGASSKKHGIALLYKSEDLINWEYVNVLGTNKGEWGYMWECPDLFPMGDKYVLTFSPMGAGDHTAVYMIGDLDYNTGRFNAESVGDLDYGMDFYAPQSFEAPDGRRLMVSWANEWQWMSYFKDWGPTYKEGWCGFFNIIREVKITEDGKLALVPIEEIKSLRIQPLKIDAFRIGKDDVKVRTGDGVCFELKFVIDIEKTDAKQLHMYLRENENNYTVCTFDFEHADFFVDRNKSDDWSVGVSKSVLFLKEQKKLDVHIISDNISLEIFIDEGRNNHSNNIYARNDMNGLRFVAEGGQVVINNFESYGLRACMF